MFYNTNVQILPTTVNHNIENATEKVYVDWPEENSEEYRFVSSRMEDIESDFHPLIAADDIKKGVDVTRNLSDLKISNKPPIQSNKRYEDLSRKQEIRHKNSSIPPLDLISQHSSIEIPGAKGAIDIDFRSTTDSMSEFNDEQDDNIDVDRDVLDNNQGQYVQEVYQTTLPRVPYEDLIINPLEYNSSRNSHGVSRRLSDITAPSQYRTTAPIGPNYSQYDSTTPNARENEQIAFESVQQRYKYNAPAGVQPQTSLAKHDSSSANSLSKIQKSKPTLHVAPQIKAPLGEKSPNFIELNKVTLNQPKLINQSSYSNKFADRQRKDSPNRTVKKSTTAKDIPVQTYSNTDKVDRNPTLSAQEYWTKRDRSVERLTGEHREQRDYREYRDDNQEQVQRQIYPSNNSNVIYAFNQYGEPLIIGNNEGNFIGNVMRPPDMSYYPATHQTIPDYHTQSNMIPQNPIITSPRAQRLNNNYQQEMRRSVDSDHIFHDAPFKRQPTLYDEKLLEKKTKIVSLDRITSHLPPLPSSSDSNMSQNNGYSAHLRKKDASYEQYTLRDFKNIKQINSVGGLGPNLGTESHKQMRDKLIRQKNYSKAVKEKNQELLRNREREAKEQYNSSALKVEDISHRENEEMDSNNPGISQDINSQDTNVREEENEEKNEKPTSKLTTSAGNTKTREQAAKRDLMINYSKSVKEKQLKKQISKSKLTGSQTEISKKDYDSPQIVHELFNNSDLDRLLQRHESDKRMTDQIRQKWEKIN